VISNTANIIALGGKTRNLPNADLFFVTLNCHDINGEFSFLSFTRDLVTHSSYHNAAICTQVETWVDGVPGLA